MIIVDVSCYSASTHELCVDIFRNSRSCGIHGTIDVVCNQIIKRTCSGINPDGTMRQVIDVFVLTTGYGVYVARYLEREGLKVNRINTIDINVLLPII